MKPKFIKMETNIEILRRVMEKGMIDNFTKDGCLIPVFFWIENNQPEITQIPTEYLSNIQGKRVLGDIIRTICDKDNVTAAGIIFEAYAVKMHEENDADTVKKIADGDLKVSDMNEKQDIIVLIFSTPNSHEIITYNVDCENNKVLDEYVNDSGGNHSGVFNDFFKWKNNKNVVD
jgi:hypothetical protein